MLLVMFWVSSVGWFWGNDAAQKCAAYSTIRRTGRPQIKMVSICTGCLHLRSFDPTFSLNCLGLAAIWWHVLQPSLIFWFVLIVSESRAVPFALHKNISSAFTERFLNVLWIVRSSKSVSMQREHPEVTIYISIKTLHYQEVTFVSVVDIAIVDKISK